MLISQDEVKAAIEAEKTGIDPTKIIPKEPEKSSEITTLIEETLVSLSPEQLATIVKDAMKAGTEETIARIEAQKSIDSPKATPFPEDLKTTYIAAKAITLPGKEAILEFEKLLKAGIQIPLKDDRQSISRDNRSSDNWLESNRSSLREGYEDLLRKECGMFTGEKAAATTLADIPASFKDFLTAEMRKTPRMGKILWQFLHYNLRIGENKGVLVNIARPGLLPSPTISSAWDLEGIEFSDDAQNVTNGYEEVRIKQRGMGGTGKNNNAVKIDRFYLHHSLTDLLKQFQECIWNNYYNYEEIATIEQLITSPAVRFYKSGDKSIRTLASDIAAGEGEISIEGLAFLKADLLESGLIPYQDGCLMMICHPRVAAKLTQELRQEAFPNNPQQLKEVTNLLKAQNPNVLERISGYVATIEGFHIFMPEGPLLFPSMYQATEGGRLWYESYIIGQGAIAQAVSLPAMIYLDEMKKYGTSVKGLWYSYQNIQKIDGGGPTTGAGLGPTTQIYKLRTSRP
jgi:hypothetical protein